MKNVCIGCGVEFITGKGWAEEHAMLCINDRYGWNWCLEVPDEWKPGDIMLPPSLVLSREPDIDRLLAVSDRIGDSLLWNG